MEMVLSQQVMKLQLNNYFMKHLTIGIILFLGTAYLLFPLLPTFLDATMLLLQLCFTITTILLPLLLIVGAVFGVAKLTKRI